MAGYYKGVTKKGYPVDAMLYDEFTRQNIDRQSGGDPGWGDYDSWYEEIKLPKPVPPPAPESESPQTSGLSLRKMSRFS